MAEENDGPYFDPVRPMVYGWGDGRVSGRVYPRCENKRDPVTLAPFSAGDRIVVEEVGTEGKIRCYDPDALQQAVAAAGWHPITREPVSHAARVSINDAVAAKRRQEAEAASASSSSPLGSGVDVPGRPERILDPADGVTYLRTSRWGAILGGDYAAWQNWHDEADYWSD